jgi:hypothetical protein
LVLATAHDEASGFGKPRSVKCSEGSGAMRIVRRTPHPARADHEKPTLQCFEHRHSKHEPWMLVGANEVGGATP